MRYCFLALALFAASFEGFGQTAPATPQALPKDPRAILAAAEPYYNFSDPSLKPWHLKATYQLYDEKGKPTEQGTYEYWWASPKVYRDSWTRPGASRSNWHTEDGKDAYRSSGSPLRFDEYRLHSTFFSPLPHSLAEAPNPAGSKLIQVSFALEGKNYSCLIQVPQQFDERQKLTLGLAPTFCFDPNVPMLRFEAGPTAMLVTYEGIAKIQGRFLPTHILIQRGTHLLLSATVNQVDDLNPTDSALMPPPDAKVLDAAKISVASKIAEGHLIKKVMADYPPLALSQRISGNVLLRAIIGADGKVHDVQVLHSSWSVFDDSAVAAVSRWRYKPFEVNGRPISVYTTISVFYQP